MIPLELIDNRTITQYTHLVSMPSKANGKISGKKKKQARSKQQQTAAHEYPGLYKVAENDKGGRPVKGCYPEVDRTVLAKICGHHHSFISYILLGRTTPRLDLAVKMAGAIGVPIEEFFSEIGKAAKRYAKERERADRLAS